MRNVGLRPWAKLRDGAGRRWRIDVEDRLREVYTSGVEGLPQPRAQSFAVDWAAYCGCDYALLLPHGTDALRIALAAALDHDGLDYGGEIIVPNYSFVASATAALDRRFGVAFVDVDPNTLLLDPAAFEAAIVPGRTRAVMPVHLFGQPSEMAAINAIAEHHGLTVVEDAAQAHGAETREGRVGGLARAAGFSFQSTKNLNCGEGGALTTNDETLFERAYSMHNAGRSISDPGRWVHVNLGWNCRMTEYQASLLQDRLGRFPAEQAIREVNFSRLRQLLAEIECVTSVTVRPDVVAHGMYMFAMRYNSDACGGLGLDRFLELVRAEGIPIYRAFDRTLAEQPVMQSLAQLRPQYVRAAETPCADRAATDTAYISQEVFLGDAVDMDDIAAAILKVEQGVRRYPDRWRDR